MCADASLVAPPHLDEDACLDFAAGLLDEREMQAALAHSAGCGECEDRLRASLAAHERGRARVAGVLIAASPDSGILRAPVLEPAAGAVAVAPVAPAERRRPLLPPGGWLAAAGLVAAIGGAWLFSTGPAEGPLPGRQRPVPAAVRLPALEGVEFTRNRDSAAGDSLMFAGFAAYERGDLERAAWLLASARVENGFDRMRRVYLAGAQLELGAPALALATLEGLRAVDIPEPWRGEMEWSRLVAFAALGRHASADSMLGLLEQGAGPVRERAQALRAQGRPAG